MKTQCTGAQFEFHALGRRSVTGRFDGGRISSDAGGVLLREVDKRIGLTGRVSRCWVDYRNRASVEHSVDELVAQRLYGIALGYEDLNDHGELRCDAVLSLLVGKSDVTGERRVRERDRGYALASASTLNRMELGEPHEAEHDRYKRIVARPEGFDELLVELFVESHSQAPRELWLDLDATDDPLHGHQQGRFFHGYYRCYCYLPLYIFCGEHVLCARLRASNQDASAGCLEELERIVGQLRRHWPRTRIHIRGDSGFCRESIMKWCEDHGVGFVLGLVRAQLAHPLGRLRIGGAEHELARGVVPQDGHRSRVLHGVPGTMRERVLDARHRLAGEHTERARRAAGVEERLLTMHRIARREAVELVGHVADERQIGTAPDPIRIVEHGLEEQGLEAHGDQVVDAVPGGLEEHERSAAATGDRPGEVDRVVPGVPVDPAGLAAEVERSRNRGRGEVAADDTRRPTTAPCGSTSRARGRSLHR